MGQAWASLQEKLQGRHWKERQVRKITDKVFDRLTEDAPKREKEALKCEEVYIAVLCVYNDINKYLLGPHYDPPSKERLKELMISMMGAAYGMAVGVASMGVTACAVTFTVGGLSAINAVAGAFSENLPVICIVEGPNSNDYGSNRILHHTIGIPDFTQELRCFQNVTCYQDPELWKKKNIPVGDIRSFCLIIQRQRWLLLEASSSAWLSWL